MTDPRGWEALTQAEGDADVRGSGTLAALLAYWDLLEREKAVAERERDEAREALRASFSRLILARATMRTYLKHGDRDTLEAWLLAAKENGWLEEIEVALAGGPQT